MALFFYVCIDYIVFIVYIYEDFQHDIQKMWYNYLESSI